MLYLNGFGFWSNSVETVYLPVFIFLFDFLFSAFEQGLKMVYWRWGTMVAENLVESRRIKKEKTRLKHYYFRQLSTFSQFSVGKSKLVYTSTSLW